MKTYDAFALGRTIAIDLLGRCVCMKKEFGIILAVVLSIVLSACKMLVTHKNAGNYPESTKDTAVYGNEKMYQWNNEISFPFPAPGAASYEVTDTDGVYCRGMAKSDLDEYLTVLKSGGWEALDNSSEGSSEPVYSVLLKDNMVINITDQTMVNDSHIRIHFSRGYMPAKPDGRLSKAEAMKLIQKHINNLTDEKQPGYGKVIYRLVEMDIKDSFERMGLQAFSAYDESGKNQ